MDDQKHIMEEPEASIPKDPKQAHKDAEQTFTIAQDGTIDIGWVQPEFSDVILELIPDEKKINDELNKGKKPRIFCG